MIRKYLLIILLQSITLYGSAQEFWSGTKNTTSTISRTGPTTFGSLNIRTSGTSTVVEHNATTGDIYLRSVASTTNGDSGNIILNDAGGYVGIGTTHPQSPLHIAAPNVSNTPRAAIVLSRYWLDDANTRASAIFHYSDGANEKLAFAVAGLGGTDDNPVSLSQAKMVVQANGNVGIGVITPKQKLSVNGTVLAKEVKVSTAAADWPDYVFDKDYKLQPLDRLEKQITALGHLPGMPAAGQVQKDGIQVGTLLSQQQKKIEELTLYILGQQKEIKALKKQFEALQKDQKYH